MFNSSPVFQTAVALLVLFLSFAAHVRKFPYLSKSVAASVPEQTPSQRRPSASNALAASVRTSICNYNTLESAMLFSNSIVMISGIMYASGRWRDDDGEANRWEHTVLTYCVVAVIASSAAYLAVVVLLQMVRCDPAAAAHCDASSRG